MNADTINAIKEALTPIAAKIGQGAEYGWEVVFRQQYVEAAIGLVYFLFGIILAIIVYKICKKAYKECEEDRYSSWAAIGVIVGIFGGVSSLLLMVDGLTTAISHYLNPAYYAIKFFIGLAQ